MGGQTVQIILGGRGLPAKISQLQTHTKSNNIASTMAAAAAPYGALPKQIRPQYYAQRQ